MFTASLVGFITVPVALKYFKTEQYGVWTVISSVLVYLAVSNLGVNSAASVLMAKSSGYKEKLIILLRSLKIVAAFVLLVLASFIALNLYSRDWIFILGRIPPVLVRQTYLTGFILGVFYLVNLPFSLISAALNGFQKVYIDNVFSAVLAVVNFTALLLTIFTGGGLVRFALFTGGLTLGFNLVKLAVLYFFVLRRAEARSAAAEAGATGSEELSYGSIIRTGFRFLLLGIAAMIVWNTDNFLISRILGVSAVVPYSITFKLFYIMFSSIFIINNSSLSLMGQEYGRQNWEWINKIYSKLLTVTVIIGGLAWLVGLFFLKDVIHLWVGDEGYAGLAVVFFLGAYSYIFGVVNLNSGLINAFNYTKNMPLVGWLEAGLKFGFTLLCLKLWGIAGAAVGTFTGCLLSNTWILPIVLHRRSGGRIKTGQDFVLRHLVLILLPLVCAGLLTQLYAGSAPLRLACGVAGVAVYSYFSYKLAPQDVRDYVKELVLKFKSRYARS